jgi:hypothetical protein
VGDEGALQRRRTREVVSAIRCVVTELAELLACRLQLGAKRAVCPRALVLERIVAEDSDPSRSPGSRRPRRRLLVAGRRARREIPR